MRQRSIRFGLLVGEGDALSLEGGDGFAQLRDLLRDPRLALARKRELLLESRHFGVRRIERALLLMQCVTRRIVFDA